MAILQQPDYAKGKFINTMNYFTDKRMILEINRARGISEILEDFTNPESFTMEDFQKSVETIEKAQTSKYVYTSICLECKKRFFSEKQTNVFIDCKKHQNNKDYIMIKPLR